MKNGKNTQFSSYNQPSGEAKSKGWERRRQAQEFMDKIMSYQKLTIKEFEMLEKVMKKSKEKFTVGELMAFNYASKLLKSDKYLLDWMDRHIGKAPINKEEDLGTHDIEIIIGDDEDDLYSE